MRSYTTWILTGHPAWAAALLLTASLAACSRDEARPPAPVAKPVRAAAPATVAASWTPYQAAPLGKESERQLMEAIYEEEFDAATGKALVSILADGDYGNYMMELVAANKLPDGTTAVIVNGMPADEDGNEQPYHLAEGMLNVYVARHDKDGWTVLERYENLGSAGTNGRIGSIEWIAPGPGKQGFILSAGGVWQGHAMSVAHIYDLAEGVRHLGEFPEMSSNSGACRPDSEGCWEVDSKMRFVDGAPAGPYRDVLVQFTEKRYTVTEDAKGDFVEHASAPVKHTTMRYRFDGKRYMPAAGTNPVPDI